MPRTTNILVVDDDTPIVDFIAEVLRDEGYTVYPAYHTAAALAAFESAPIDLVLLDLHMPGLNGIDLVRYLQDQGLGDIPVVMMTADTRIRYERSKHGIQYLLMKPFDLDVLIACIAGALRDRQDGLPPSSLPTVLGAALMQMPNLCL
jgi:DNA-binding response OmpR family regulator